MQANSLEKEKRRKSKLDYLFKPPTQMQENSMTGMQQAILAQAPLEMGMRPFENARGAMPEPPELDVAADPIMEANYQIARRHLEFLRSGLSDVPEPYEEYHWLRNITGGGRATFSSKRNADGSLKMDMKPEIYDKLWNLTNSFYDTAKTLAEQVPREQELTLYRGIRIPKVKEGASKEEIEEIMSRYGDVIPSSASWGMEAPRHFSDAEEGQDAVVLHMIVPPDFPLVMLSCPEKVRGRDPQSLDIQGQQEVLVGASTFSEVRLLETAERGGHHCYHVEVKLNAVPREVVIAMIENAWESHFKEEELEEEEESEESQSEQEQPEILEQRFLLASKVAGVFGMELDKMEVGQKYESLEHPGVWYELKKKAFSSTFELVKEQAEE